MSHNSLYRISSLVRVDLVHERHSTTVTEWNPEEQGGVENEICFASTSVGLNDSITLLLRITASYQQNLSSRAVNLAVKRFWPCVWRCYPKMVLESIITDDSI
ncbi:hypothetical protein FVEG_16515 [Fusarium verticillioides 7600]|uniref:Uncharacterized protein n=1 Tax=Gibberella moniliformis (strain M3125 / FGSC 7600) TaxID=334819 RepID=W7MDH5_GIBM7|nr:hypothetical protein FVEG_16515 [Fusarium verticillioides 7600]EWG49593.1 hypothetical protein FVEG_16515 [Fusarium verticillioides 7600]